MAKLIINPTSGAKKEIPMAGSVLSIGRDPSNDLVLSDAMVSRRHAILELRGEHYVIRDNNSSNGTLVNGDRVVSERALRDGDLIAIGSSRLLFQMDEVIDLPQESPGDGKSPARGLAAVALSRGSDASCLACGAVAAISDQYCRQCGKELPARSQRQVTCSSCGHTVSLPAQFCGACGKVLLKEEKPHFLPTQPLARGDLSAAAGGKSLASPARTPTAPLAVPAAAPRPSTPATAPTPVAPFRPRPLPGRSVAPSGDRRPSEPAGFWIRLSACLIDGLFVSAPLLVAAAFGSVAALFQGGDPALAPAGRIGGTLVATLGLVLTLLLSVVYPIYFWTAHGATPGKKILGLAVLTDEGTSPIGFRRACLRYLGYLLSGAVLGLGFLPIVFAGDKRGLHDRIGGTHVVRWQ